MAAALLALLVFLGGSSAARLPDQSTVKDSQSGVAFPVALVPPGGSAPHRLMGTATREKTIFRIKVYAYGLYVDGGAARAALGAFAGRPAEALARDSAFFQQLLRMQIPMTLRLVMVRDVSGAALGEAFDDALKPRVAKAPAGATGLDGPTALAAFRTFFNLREVARSTEIVFSCSPNGELRTAVDGQSRSPLQSQALCWALFDVYLGDKPVSLDGRRSLISGFPAWLAGSR